MAAEESSNVNLTSNDNNSGSNGPLELYYWYTSFYSRKVLFALHEKRLHFKSNIVNLSKGEQYQPWYLKLNPRGEVPVLKDGVKVIPDSERIIDYLEDNFSNGSTPRLMPEKGTEETQHVKQMRELLDAVPVPLITFGCLYHHKLTTNMKISSFERKQRLSFMSTVSINLDLMMEKYPEFKELYQEKKQRFETFRSDTQHEDKVKAVLDNLEGTLDTVEQELASHEGDKSSWWLCSQKFAIPDITLALILHRLHELGLSARYLTVDKRPHLVQYFKRVQEREGYKKTLGHGAGFLHKICCSKKKGVAAIGVAATVISVIALGAVVYKRMK
ncbi:ganglioside-induced differentiation-associated protein 1-like [Limulus polyphemus]|uniref:Ganglioside-induced differentiation-associated protein 1-like n=1 Tax=Limulus polyphemus TaxID=6850 RepID=A0ABM1BHZ0_LIMPO|nr:ganglioside-induced differentiation-associated protein 1-like [Limulus polyphemus]